LKSPCRAIFLCARTDGQRRLNTLPLPFQQRDRRRKDIRQDGKKYEAGMYNIAKTGLYINRGIGLEGGSAPQVRFLARPEITVFDIEPAR